MILGLKDTAIPNDVTTIGAGAFAGRSNLTSITLPESVARIDSAAFSGCSGLTSITIPNSVTSIGNHAFAGCSALTSVDIPNSVTSIGSRVFYGCSGLTSVDIPNSVTAIDDYAFSGCSALTSVDIPNSVTRLGYDAFSNCSGLTSVTIPESVTTIDNYAFSGCSALNTVICKVTSRGGDTSDLVPPAEPVAPEPGIDPVFAEWLMPFNPAHPVAEATMSNYTEVDDTDLYDKVYTEEECREKWTEYYQAVKDNLGTAARRLNVQQQVNVRMNYYFTDGDRYLKRDGELVNKTTYANEWNSYEWSLEQYESDLLRYGYMLCVPKTYYSTFYNVSQSDATLYVYASVIDAYKAIEPWSSFGTILPIDEEDPSAVETLPASEDGTSTMDAADAPIYDMVGRRLAEKPTSGIYIQGGKKYLVK